MSDMKTEKEEILEEVLEELEAEAAASGENASGGEPGGTDAEAAETGEAEAAGEEPGGADAGEEAADEDEPKAAEAEKKGFFKKKKDKKDEQIEELNDKLRRQMAEFDNFRKRTDKEKAQMYDMGARSIIEKMLPVIDNFERGLAAVPDEAKEDAFVVGMDKIYKQLLSELETIGVAPIEAVGKEFDPEFHNAVMQVENGELESGVIAQELQKGYTYKDTVVRHSMVAVVQ